jgi:hypothetical protein
MPISSELSSEIAAALLGAMNRSPREMNDLKEIVLRIHSTLRQMTNESHVGSKQPKVDSEESSSEQ